VKLPVFKAFGATYSLVLGNLFTCIQIVWLPLAILYAGFYFIADKLFPIIVALVRTMPEKGADAAEVMPVAILHLLAPLLQWQGVIFLAGLVLTAMMAAGLLKFAVRGEKPSLPFYLGFGGAELGLILTWILVFIILMAVYIGFAIGVGTLALTIASLSKELVPLVLAVAVVFCLVIFVWLLLRLSLAGAGSIAVRGIGIGPAWFASRGNALNLLGFWILVFLPIIGIGMIESAVMKVFLLPDFLDMFFSEGGHMTHEEGADLIEKVFASIHEKLPILLAIAYVARLITIPILNCAAGIAYRMTTEGDG